MDDVTKATRQMVGQIVRVGGDADLRSAISDDTGQVSVWSADWRHLVTLAVDADGARLLADELAAIAARLGSPQEVSA